MPIIYQETIHDSTYIFNKIPIPAPPGGSGIVPGVIAPFARFNYYREAVKRMKGLSGLVRARYGGKKSEYRILCNSPVP